VEGLRGLYLASRSRIVTDILNPGKLKKLAYIPITYPSYHINCYMLKLSKNNASISTYEETA